VDKPKPGFGNSNDGNTARRFFENVEKSAEITGLSKTILKNFKIVLITLSSGCKIDTKKFNEFCQNTAKTFVNEYGWYYMPTTVHKILIHSSRVIESSLLPIGQLSEEAQEARHKDFKVYRRSFSRKSSRVNTLEDVFKRLLVSSDPQITNLGMLPKKKIKALPEEVLNLIVQELSDNDEESDIDEDSSEEEEDFSS